MKDTRSELTLYSFYDLHGMARHLEAMAEKGWLLDRVTNCRWIYRRDTPRRLHYTVSYYAKASAFEPEPSEGEEIFHDFCAYSGWHLAASNAKLQIFYNEQEDPLPIHTDPESELSCIEKIAKSNIFAYLLLAFITGIQFLLVASGFLSDPVSHLADTLTLCVSLALGLICGYFLVDLFLYFHWHKKARAAAENGEFLDTRSHPRLLSAILLLSIFLLAAGVLTIRLPGLQLLLIFMLLALLLLNLIVNGVRVGLKKKKVSTGKNRVITLAVDFTLALVLFLGITFGSIAMMQKGLLKDSYDYPVAMPITAEELTGSYDDRYIEESRFKSSIFVSYSHYYQHIFQSEGAPLPTLSCTVVDVKWNALYDFCLRKTLHQYDTFGDHDPDYDPEHPFYVYQPIDSALFDTEQAFQRFSYGTPDQNYVLTDGRRIVTLETDIDLTPEQMARCGKAFFLNDPSN